jgi:hypothetical protein
MGAVAVDAQEFNKYAPFYAKVEKASGIQFTCNTHKWPLGDL